MDKLEFDDEGSRLVEEYNATPGARARRLNILKVLALKLGERVLDVGSGPGHQAFELSSVVGPNGSVEGIDLADSALAISRNRCSELGNIQFQLGDAYNLPFRNGTFDAVMSSQVFEYLDDVGLALTEMFRVLRSGGRVLIHDTEWGALMWNSGNADRMAKFMKIWDGHLADPHLPRTLGKKLTDAGFVSVQAEAFVPVETRLDPISVSAVLMKFVTGYVMSQGVSRNEADAWENDLATAGANGDYFYSSNEYIFTAKKP